VARSASVEALGLKTLWPGLMWLSTRAALSSVSVGPIYHLVECAVVSEG